MAKEATNVRQQEAVKELVVDARFVLRSFDADDGNGKKISKDYVSFELIDPFKDEDFRDIALKAKWDKLDDKGRLVRPDRVFGYMSYYARKELRKAPEVHVKVTIKPITYKNKKTGEFVTYPGMYAAPTFVELEDERPVEVVVKGVINANIFVLLAGKALGISFTSREENDEDIGLNG